MEISQAYQWVDSMMRADSALMAASVGGVWQGFANVGTVGPYASYTEQAGTDVTTANATRIFSSLLLQIKAVGPAAQFAALTTIANRIDVLFGSKSIAALSPGYMLSCYREQPLA